MRRFSKHDNQAICNYCGKWQPTDLTNQQLEEMDWKCDECKAKEQAAQPQQVTPPESDHGSKEISKYDPEYAFLVKLVKLVTSEGVPPQEIKSIADAYPFVTVDDVGDLTAKIWTLATEKYHIPREWLVKRLPKNASLKTAGQIVRLFDTKVYTNPNMTQIMNALKNSEFQGLRYIRDAKNNVYVWDASAAVHQDMGEALGLSDETVQDAGYVENPADAQSVKSALWPAQEEADDMIDHAPGYLAYEYGQDKTSAEFTGAEFSKDDVGVSPTVDIGPFSSPEDHGAKPQKSPFPNTGWLPADDENRDEQPASNVASVLKRPFSKKARTAASSWIDPNGKIFSFGDNTHDTWAEANAEMLKTDYNLDLAQMNPNTDSAVSYLIDNGWTRAAVADTALVLNTKDIGHIDQCDDYIAQNWAPHFQYVLIETFNGNWVVNDPFPTLSKGVQKGKKMAKQADLSGQTVNQIVNALHANGGATWNLSQGNMVGTDNYAVAIYPERAQILDGADFDRIEEYITSNSDLLYNPENSFGAWSHDGKVYLDVVATVPDVNQAVELGKQHNQIAIWDLKNAKQISTGGTGEVKQAAQNQVLPQPLQDQIAAETSPAYNIALNNYAQAVRRGHEKDRSLAYAIESVSNIDKIDPKKLVELINQYL